MTDSFPRRLACLTEESVEILYQLGAQDKIAGISCFVKRPQKARKAHPVISSFLKAQTQELLDLNIDLAIGYSDVQKEVALELTGLGINLFISHHRSLEEIFDYVLCLARLVDKVQEGHQLVRELKEKIAQVKERASQLKRRPRVYLEEWDEPRLAGSLWWSQIVELCGGQDLFSHLAKRPKAGDRIVDDKQLEAACPDIMLVSWCGKPFSLERCLKTLPSKNWQNFRQDNVIELEAEIFLQPGIAPILSGCDILLDIFERWESEKASL